METEHIGFRAELCWRELVRNMTVCLKYEIVFGYDKKANNILFGAADTTLKVVRKTVGENVLRSRATGDF